MEVVLAYIKSLFNIENQLAENIYELEAIIDGPFVGWESLQLLVKNSQCTKKIYREKKFKNDRGNIIYRQKIFNDGTIVSECKSKLFSKTARDFWVKFFLSSEIPATNDFDSTPENLIHRYTIDHKDCIIEIGFNQTSKSSWIEVEKTKNTTKESFLDTIIDVISILQQGMFMSKPEYEDVLTLIPLNYAKPVTLTKNNLRELSEYKFISKKYDGIRIFIIFNLGKIYRIDIKKFVSCIDSTTEKEITILDCEYVNNIFYIIDII